MPITQWAKTLCSVENMIYSCPHLDEAESDTTEPYVDMSKDTRSQSFLLAFYPYDSTGGRRI